MITLFNTLSRKKELFASITPQTIGVYTCGPTVYHYVHIGNLRTYVFEDVLRRAIQYFGFGIEQVMNLTDLDDKTIRGAIENKISLKEFTDPFKKAFFEDLDTLNIQRVEHYPAATEYIPEMIKMIEVLIEKGFAYKNDHGSVYFSIQKFPSYGRLSHLRLDELEINASGDNNADEYEKDNLSDFVLWKGLDKERDGDIYWESPFGPGRPGWHIECSAMATKLLGTTIDIHCGGVDNMFPHHENEIAQSECCTGAHFVHKWVHAEHLLVNHKKMSKSAGNFFTLRDLLLKGYTGPEIRYLLLSTHYRTQLNFTFEGLDAARASLQRVRDLFVRLSSIHQSISQPISSCLDRAKLRFQTALSDDLNISACLGALFDLVRELNTLCDENKLGLDQAQEALNLFKDWDRVLGVFSFEQDQIPDDLIALLEEREVARKEKKWARGDEIRDEIHAKGYEIDDTPNGARLKKR